MAANTLFSQDQSALGVKVSITWNKSVLLILRPSKKRKALVATLSNTKSEDGSDNKDDRILNAFIATVNPTEGIVEDVDEEEDLVESKFEKIDEQDDIHTTYARL